MYHSSMQKSNFKLQIPPFSSEAQDKGTPELSQMGGFLVCSRMEFLAWTRVLFF
jgi:hypothetical protein